ncbi:MAG: LysM peptidoglycan-binding domain-containing protein [Treponema sp.]|nr:LysM peptidoglycan-binding domain-containing protein [Treponema sp.]
MKRVSVRLIIPLVFGLAACGGTPAPAPVADLPEPPAQPAPEAPREGIILDGADRYTVVRGDTLAEIAAGKYGRPNMYYFPLIHLGNTEIIQDPDVIEVGSVLTIPNLQRNLDNPGATRTLKTGMLNTSSQYERQSKPKAAATLRQLADKLPK